MQLSELGFAGVDLNKNYRAMAILVAILATGLVVQRAWWALSWAPEGTGQVLRDPGTRRVGIPPARRPAERIREVLEPTQTERPQEPLPEPTPWPDELPDEYRPAEVHRAVERSKERCHESSGPDWIVDCESFPCIVVTLSHRGVVDPFCEAANAPEFPGSWTLRSPILPSRDRYTLAQPMAPEFYLADPNLRADIHERISKLVEPWVHGTQ